MHHLWQPFQGEGVKFLATHPRALLLDDPGLGKTVQAVVAWSKLKDLTYDRTLVLCSRKKIDDWADCFKQWTETTPTTLKAVGRQRREDLLAWDSGVLIVNREAIRLLPGLTEMSWDVVILDEAHHAKHRKAKFTQALLHLASVRKWGLTATPIEGDIDVVLKVKRRGTPRVQDLWSQLNWLDHEAWPSYWKFVNRYCKTEKTFWSQFGIVGPDFTHLGELSKRVSQYALRRRSSDVPGQLPKVSYEDWWIGLSPEERRVYDRMAKSMLVWIDANTSLAAPTALAQLSRLIRLTLGPEGYGKSQLSTKADSVVEFLQDSPADYKVVVASSYKQTIVDLVWRLKKAKDISPSILTGESKKPEEELKQFSSPDGPQVMLMTTATGGEGLSFSNAQAMIVTDLPWSSTQYFQLTRRIVRGDSTHEHVRVIRVLAKDTIDELLVEMHRSKRPLSPKEIVFQVRKHLEAK